MTKTITEEEIKKAEKSYSRREEIKKIVEEDKDLLKKLE